MTNSFSHPMSVGMRRYSYPSVDRQIPATSADVSRQSYTEIIDERWIPLCSSKKSTQQKTKKKWGKDAAKNSPDLSTENAEYVKRGLADVSKEVLENIAGHLRGPDLRNLTLTCRSINRALKEEEGIEQLAFRAKGLGSIPDARELRRLLDEKHRPELFTRIWKGLAGCLFVLPKAEQLEAFDKLTSMMMQKCVVADSDELNRLIAGNFAKLHKDVQNRASERFCGVIEQSSTEQVLPLLTQFVSTQTDVRIQPPVWDCLIRAIKKQPLPERADLLTGLTSQMGRLERWGWREALNDICSEIETLAPVPVYQLGLIEALRDCIYNHSVEMSWPVMRQFYTRLYNVTKAFFNKGEKASVFTPADQERAIVALIDVWHTIPAENKKAEFDELSTLVASIAQPDFRAAMWGTLVKAASRSESNDFRWQAFRHINKKIQSFPKQYRAIPIKDLIEAVWEMPDKSHSEALQQAYGAIARLAEHERKQYADFISKELIRYPFGYVLKKGLLFAADVISKLKEPDRKFFSDSFKKEVSQVNDLSIKTKMRIKLKLM